MGKRPERERSEIAFQRLLYISSLLTFTQHVAMSTKSGILAQCPLPDIDDAIDAHGYK